MPLKFSTTSTGSLAGSSGGASPKGSTKRWGRRLYRAAPQTMSGSPTARFRFHSEEEVSGNDSLLLVEDSTGYSPALVLRMQCEELLDQIPDEGLDELYETINNIIEFYASRITDESLLYPETRTTTAKVVNKYERPDFYISEE